MLTYQEEYWPEAKQTLMAMGGKSYAEVDLAQERYGYDLDDGALDRLDDMGLFMTTSARLDGLIIGFTSCILSPRHVMFGASCATQIITYIEPEHRSASTFIAMMRANEQHLKKRGVKRVYGGYTVNKNLSPLFKRLGWKEAEVRCVKWLD